jgi:hypothetical protein
MPTQIDHYNNKVKRNTCLQNGDHKNALLVDSKGLSCSKTAKRPRNFGLVDHVIPRVPVRQWVLSFPIPLRILFAAHPELLSPVLQIIHRVIASLLIKQAGLKRSAADTGAVTLIQH